MTSLWRHLWLTYQTYRVSLLSGCVKLMAWRVFKIWWWSVRNFGRYRRKTTGEEKIAPPPSGRGSTRHPLGYFRTHDRLGQVSDPTPLLSREPIVVSSPTRRRSKTLHKISPLTRDWPGGGLFFAPLLFFCDISRSYVRIIVKFLIPSKPSILHVLTKGKLASFDTSAINDVRVTSCFPGFRKK